MLGPLPHSPGLCAVRQLLHCSWPCKSKDVSLLYLGSQSVSLPAPQGPDLLQTVPPVAQP